MRRDQKLFRPIPALLALVAGFALSVAIAGASKTELGGTTNSPTHEVNVSLVPVATVAGSSSYSTPDGVLTEWRFHSGSNDPAGQLKLKIFRATNDPKKFEVIGDSSLKNLDPDKSYKFEERIAVKQGDLLGLYGDNNSASPLDGTRIGITTPGQFGNVVGQFPSGDINVGSSGTTTSQEQELRVNVAATVESDADKDGYGDDTQDECPTDAKIHSSKCPTTTTAKDNRRPKASLSAVSKQNLRRQRGVFVTVNSDENGTARATATVSIERVVRVSKTYSMIGSSSAVVAGTKKTLFLRASKKLRNRVKRGFRKHRRIRAHVRIRVTDAAGNRTTKSTTIKIKRRGR